MSIYFHKPVHLFGSSLSGGERERFNEIRKEIDIFYSNSGGEIVFDNFVKTLELIERTKSHLGLKKSSNVFEEIVFYLRMKLLSTDPYVVRSTYTLLDYLVKNGGPLVHNAINNVRVMKTITTIARVNYFNDHGKGSKMVADCALDFIQGWGEAFEKEFKDTRYLNIIQGFHNLRNKYGIVYPRKSYCSSRVKIFLGRSSKFRYEYDFVPEETKAQEQQAHIGSGRTAGFSDDPDLLDFSDLEIGIGNTPVSSERDVLNETVMLRISPPSEEYNYNAYAQQQQQQQLVPLHQTPPPYHRLGAKQLYYPPPTAPPEDSFESRRTDLRVLERDNADTLHLSLMQTSSSKKRQQQDSYSITINEEKMSFDTIDFSQRSCRPRETYLGPSFSSRDNNSLEPPNSYLTAQQSDRYGSSTNPFDQDSPLHSPLPSAEPAGTQGSDNSSNNRSRHPAYFDPSSDPNNVITFYGTQRVVRKAPSVRATTSEKKSYAL